MSKSQCHKSDQLFLSTFLELFTNGDQQPEHISKITSYFSVLVVEGYWVNDASGIPTHRLRYGRKHVFIKATLRKISQMLCDVVMSTQTNRYCNLIKTMPTARGLYCLS